MRDIGVSTYQQDDNMPEAIRILEEAQEMVESRRTAGYDNMHWLLYWTFGTKVQSLIELLSSRRFGNICNGV